MDEGEASKELDIALRQTDDGDAQVLEEKVQKILNNVWKMGLTSEDALYVIRYLVDEQNVFVSAQTTVRNFVIVYLHFLAYCVYCTENKSKNLLVDNLACMLFKNEGGRKEVFKQMKTFYKFTVEEQKMHYESILLGIYVSVYTGPGNKGVKIKKEKLLQKSVITVVQNLHTDYTHTKLRAGVWNDENDFHYSKLYYRHKEVLKWSRWIE